MMSLSEAAQAIGARHYGRDLRFASVSSDTRTLERGALFVALRGERFDGHEFLATARQCGAIAAMVEDTMVDDTMADDNFEKSAADPALPCLVVKDTRIGLGRLAAHWRGRFAIPLIAVTGSNGKTTVKEMIAAILRACHGEARALATEGNFNNDIGLPLTLLRLREQHACAVVEFGMNHPGETAYLADIARPTVALVNNAQREHQEFMSSVAAVTRGVRRLLARTQCRALRQCSRFRPGSAGAGGGAVRRHRFRQRDCAARAGRRGEVRTPCRRQA